MTANITELLKLLIDYFAERIRFRRNYKTQWEKLFAGQDYNGLVFLTKFVKHNNWNIVTDDFLCNTKFGNDEYLQLIKAYTKTSELKLFAIRNDEKEISARINHLIYPEFQKNAIKYKLIERVK